MDQKQSIFNDSVRDMPWLYYDWKDPNKYKLYFEYKQYIPGNTPHLPPLGIPTLIIINPNNAVYITNEGRGMIEKEALNAFDKWLTAMSFK